MNIYSISPVKNYAFISSQTLDDMYSLINQLRKGLTTNNSFIGHLEMKSKSKRIGNICPIEVSCLTIAVDSYSKGLLSINNAYLPISCLDGFEMVVPSVIDALDNRRSEFEYFSDGKRIMTIKKYWFNLATLKGIDLFIIPDCVTPVMCTDSFADQCKKNKLSGVSFKLLFST